MAAQKLNLTRDQLASFLQDFEQIKQFEKLFSTVDDLNSTIIDEIRVDAGTAQATANDALAQLTRIADALQVLATAPVIENNNSVVTDYVDFDTVDGVPATRIGRVYWDGGTTLGVQATANVIIRVGEAEYVYAKASSAITKGQLCYHTGAVGSSGVITVAPTPLALADPNQIVGVAAETIALNGFGLIQISGDLRGFNTTGSSVGEVWADGDPLYYNPSFVGSMTKTKPSAPNQKTYIGEVTNAGSGGSGSIHIRIVPGSVLGGTDSNVQFNSLTSGDVIQYDGTLQYWKNKQTLDLGSASTLDLGFGPVRLSIRGTGSDSFEAAARFSNDANSAGLVLAKSRGATVSSRAIVASGDNLGSLQWRGDDGTNWVNAARISAEVDGTPGTNDMPGRLVFSTTPDGSSTLVECMRLSSKGNVNAGLPSLATTATDGFFYIPTCSGTPTGMPTAVAGFAPMVVDDVNNKLYVYVGGAWQVMN